MNERAVWYQDLGSFKKWRDRKITDLLGTPAVEDIVGYINTAQSFGMKVWLQYQPLYVPFFGHPNVAGVLMYPDEPNGSGQKTPAECMAIYKEIKSLTTKPVVLDLDGAAERFQDDNLISEYCKACDIVSYDYYPINRGDGPEAIPVIASLLTRMKKLAPGKQIWPVIETSDQDLRVSDFGKMNDASGNPIGLKMRGPTVAEFNLEVQTSLMAGASGIVFFPDVIGRGWEGFDGTTADISISMSGSPVVSYPVSQLSNGLINLQSSFNVLSASIKSRLAIKP